MTPAPPEREGKAGTRAARRRRRRRLRLFRTVAVAVLLVVAGFEIAVHATGSPARHTSHLTRTASGPAGGAVPAEPTTRPTTEPTTRPTTPAASPTTGTIATAPINRPATSSAPAPSAPPTSASSAVAAGCPPSGLGQPTYQGPGQQLITVAASSTSDTYAQLAAWNRKGGCWAVAYGPFEARLGYNGMSADKREGDGRTPEGIFAIGSTMYGNAPDPGVQEAYHRLVCGDWWDEDSSSPTYNTFQHVPCSETHPPFDNGSSEALWTETAPYPSFAVIEYNTARVPGAGSAIFLHASGNGPTDGCVSIPLADLDRVLDWIQPGDGPVVDIGLGPAVLRG